MHAATVLLKSTKIAFSIELTAGLEQYLAVNCGYTVCGGWWCSPGCNSHTVIYSCCCRLRDTLAWKTLCNELPSLKIKNVKLACGYSFYFFFATRHRYSQECSIKILLRFNSPEQNSIARRLVFSSWGDSMKLSIVSLKYQLKCLRCYLGGEIPQEPYKWKLEWKLDLHWRTVREWSYLMNVNS